MDQILLNAGLQCAGISDVNFLSSRLMAALLKPGSAPIMKAGSMGRIGCSLACSSLIRRASIPARRKPFRRQLLFAQ